MTRLIRSILCGLLLAALFLAAAEDTRAADFAARPEQVTPLGSTVPDAPLRRIDGGSISLQQPIGGKPAILVFYRGSWCRTATCSSAACA